MPTTYDGSTASGTIADNGVVAITEPSDGDAPDVASVNVAFSKLADIVQWLMMNTAKRGSNTTPAITLFNPTPLQMGAPALPQVQFNIPNFGVVGQHDQYRSQLWDFTYMSLKCAVYLNATLGCIEITGGCTWSYSLQKWVGDADAVLLRIFAGGPVLLTHFVANNTTGWGDNVGVGGWDSQLSLANFSSTAQGDVLGFSAAGLASFGRPREALQAIAAGAGWTAEASPNLPQGYKDSSGSVHLQGIFDNAAGNTGAYVDLALLPASLRPGRTVMVVGMLEDDAGNHIEPVRIVIDSSGNISAETTFVSTGHAIKIWLDGIVFTP